MKLNPQNSQPETAEGNVVEKAKPAHGRDKQPEVDDPMELVLSEVPGGDPEIMATCFIEEYARMGMGEEEILGLFNQPGYRTYALYEKWGESRMRDLIRKTLARTGQTRVSVQIFHQIG
jgi:hypothetical protein